MKKLNLIIGFLLIITPLFAQTVSKEHHSKLALDCKSCHSCDNPTEADPCLTCCPEFKRNVVTIHHTPEEGPDTLNIDILSNIYEPTVFPHKLHAEMGQMSGSCVSCHHHNPPGRIAACKECHEVAPIRDDLSKPGLKGAYHRQCLSCHREWSHTTDCNVCHALKGTEVPDAKIMDKSDIIGSKHPKIKEPDKVVYETAAKEGKYVTFYHNEHSGKFGFKCVDCHTNESCSRCHDLSKSTYKEQAAPAKPITVKKSADEKHESCFACHADDACTKCHSSEQKGPFDHSVTAKWPLKSYHASLKCQTCHGESKIFSSLKPTCTSCHKNWNPESFKHRVTGLVLDENHGSMDCESCHIDSNFNKKPTCDNCHDDYKYPAKKPGSLIKSKL